MILVYPLDQHTADVAVHTLHKHIPDGVDVGLIRQAAFAHDKHGGLVQLDTQLGVWFVRSHIAFRLRRLDSPLGEEWDISYGQIEQQLYCYGDTFEPAIHTWGVGQFDQALAAVQEEGRLLP